MMKTTRHSLMAKGILVLLSLLILIFVFTYSWFVDPSRPVEASGISLTTSAETDFEFAIGFSSSQTGNSYYVTEFQDGDVSLSALKVPESYNSDGTVDSYIQDGEGNDMYFDLLKDYDPIDITGDGYTLIRPAMSYGNWSVNDTSENYSLATPGEQYISFDLIFRSESVSRVALDENSYANGACERVPGNGALVLGKNNVGNSTTDSSGKLKMRDDESGNHLTTEEVYNQSIYGDFSKDAVVGSLRVAFLEIDSETYTSLTSANILQDDLTDKLKTKPTLLWVPRPDIFLDADDNEVTGWTLETGVASSVTHNVSTNAIHNETYSTYVHQYYDIFDTVNNQKNKTVVTYTPPVGGRFVASSITGNGVVFNETQNIVSISYAGPDNNNDSKPDYYYGKVRVRIWIEGTDSEARRAITGGNFQLNLDLTSVAS